MGSCLTGASQNVSRLVVVTGSLLLAAGGHSVRAAQTSRDLQGRFSSLLPRGDVCDVSERRILGGKGGGGRLACFLFDNLKSV